MSDTKLTIGIDIDGVLIDTDQNAYLQFCEQKLGWAVDYKALADTHSWYAATGGNKTAEEIGGAFERFITEVEQSQQPIGGAHEALKEIGEKADIYLITARTGILRTVTEEFLQAHLPDVRYVELSMDNLENKAPQIITFGIDYYIDDSFREIGYILQADAVKTTVIPFPAFHSVQRWRGMSDERIHWLPVWQELEDGMEKQMHPTIRRKAWEEIKEYFLPL